MAMSGNLPTWFPTRHAYTFRRPHESTVTTTDTETREDDCIVVALAHAMSATSGVLKSNSVEFSVQKNGHYLKDGPF